MAEVDPDSEERLKAALWYAVGQIVDHECLRADFNATPQFIGALTEMVWAQIDSFLVFFGCIDIENVAKDLESFAKHAGRTQISTDDVMLLTRRNEGLEALLMDHLEGLRRDNGTGAKKVGRAAKTKR